MSVATGWSRVKGKDTYGAWATGVCLRRVRMGVVAGGPDG